MSCMSLFAARVFRCVITHDLCLECPAWQLLFYEAHMSCVPCWVLVSLIKRAPPSWGGFFAVLFLRVLDLETSQQRNPPGGGVFFRSTFVVYVLFAAHVSACVLFVFACLVRQRCCMSCTALAHPHPLRQRCRMSCRVVSHHEETSS